MLLGRNPSAPARSASSAGAGSSSPDMATTRTRGVVRRMAAIARTPPGGGMCRSTRSKIREGTPDQAGRRGSVAGGAHDGRPALSDLGQQQLEAADEQRMVVDQRDADTGVHGWRMPWIGAVMRPLRRRFRAAPASDLLLRSVCHELRPSIAALSSLAQALDRAPAEGLRSELARLTVEHTAHATAVLEQAAAAANGRSGPRSPSVPLHRVLALAATAVPRQRLTVHASREAEHCPRAPVAHPADPGQSPGQRRVATRRRASLFSSEPGRARRRLYLLVTDRGAITPALTLALRRRRPPPTDRGLGLWTVRELVATHGGSLRVRPTSPRGLAIEVRLPRMRAWLIAPPCPRRAGSWPRRAGCAGIDPAKFRLTPSRT